MLGDTKKKIVYSEKLEEKVHDDLNYNFQL